MELRSVRAMSHHHLGTCYVWMAVSVPVEASSEAEIRGGAPTFKAATSGEDIRQPGEYMWHCYNDKSGAWWPSSPFETSSL